MNRRRFSEVVSEEVTIGVTFPSPTNSFLRDGTPEISNWNNEFPLRSFPRAHDELKLFKSDSSIIPLSTAPAYPGRNILDDGELSPAPIMDPHLLHSQRSVAVLASIVFHLTLHALALCLTKLYASGGP